MKYYYIRAWGKLLNSFAYYIEAEIERARKDKAPETAIYRREDGTWATFEQIESPVTKADIARIVEGLKKEALTNEQR